MGILDNAKEVAKAVQEIHNLELYQRVLSLHSDIIELVEENNRLRNENEELTKTVALKEDMTFNEPFYYRNGDETPHCPACWEGNQKAVHVTFAFDRTDATRWDCPHCKHTYMVEKDRSVKHDGPVRPRPYGGGLNSWMGR
jgi:regulator of replication initiation timing